MGIDRRALVQGALAVMLTPVGAAAAPATTGEQQMRRKLMEQLRGALAAGPNIRFDVATCRFVHETRYREARRELAEFDRREGIWRALADRHPQGIPHGALGEARMRNMLENTVSCTRKVAGEMPSSPEAADAHRRAVARLQEFEQGKGLWRYAVKAAPDEIW